MGKEGKSVNPADLFRKKMKKKDMQRIHDLRQKNREVAIATNNPSQMKEKIKELEEKEKRGKLNKYQQEKLKRLESTLETIQHKKEMEERAAAAVPVFGARERESPASSGAGSGGGSSSSGGVTTSASFAPPPGTIMSMAPGGPMFGYPPMAMPGGFPRGFSYPPGGYPPMAVPLSVPGQAAVVPQTPQAPTSTLGTAPEAGAGGPAELRAQAAHPTGAPAAFEETKLLAPKEGAPPGAGKEEVASGTKHGSDSPASPDRPTKAARSSSPLPAPTAPPGAATALLSQPSPSSFVPADTPSAPGTSPSQLPPAPHQLPLPWSAAGMPPPPPPPLPGAPFVGAMMPPYAPPFYPPAMMMMRPPPPPPPSAPPPPAMQAPTSTRPPPGVASGANSIPVAVRPGLALPTANTPSPPPLPMTSAADYSPAAAGPLPGPRAPLAWTPPPPPPLPVPVPAVHPPEDDASPRAAQPGETATRNGGSGGIVGPARPPTTISAPPRLVGGAPSAPALPHTGVVEKPAFVPSTVLLKRAAAPTMRRPRTHAHPAAGASAAGAGLPAISAAPDVALPGAPVAPTQADASTAATADADYEQFMKDMKELGAI